MRRGSGCIRWPYRARLIGGSLDVQRRSPRGAVVTCTFPLHRTPLGGENLRHASDDV